MTVTEEDGVVTLSAENLTVIDNGNGTVGIAAGWEKQHFYFQSGLTFED